MELDQPLSHLTVVETPGDVAVRYCGRLFAALGARVIAPAARPDDDRIGFAGESGQLFGRWLDQSKSLRAELGGQAPDLEIAGLDQAAILKAEQERSGSSTLLALSWFDPDGCYGAWRGRDEVIAALSGSIFGFGRPEGPPMMPQGHGPQIIAGLVGFNAALAALLLPPNRRPRRVDVNVLEAAMCLTEPGAAATAAEGTQASRLGVNRFVPTYPSASYRAKDGWIGVTALTPAQWSALAAAIGRPDLASDPRFATAYERLIIAEEVDAILQPAFVERTVRDWVAVGLERRVPIVEMPRPAALPKMPHWRARDAFSPVEAGILGPTLPWRMRFDGRPRPRWAPGEAPLSGLRVADFSMGWAGPLCARTLGDLGADVVKVESATHPDWWRGWEAGGDIAFRESRHTFIGVNRNKRGVDLDLTNAKGVSRARTLIASADVVVENFAAGVMDKLGLGQADQHRLAPGIISLTMPAFGADGPLSETRAYGSTVEQASGLPFVNGEADWPPALQHVAYGDPIAGLFAAAAVLAALAGRERLGGAAIDLSQVACLFQLGADAIIADQRAGPIARTGLARARLSLCAVVPASDGWLVLAADASAATALSGVTGGSDEPALARWAKPLKAREAAERLQAAGVPAAPVLAAHDLTADPHLVATGFWPTMDRAFVGRHRVPATPFRFDGQRPSLRLPAPTLGEHTREIFEAV